MAEKRTMTLEFDDMLRVTIVDGEPELSVLNTYAQEQQQDEPWVPIAHGGEVLEVLGQLREFVEKNTNLRSVRPPQG